MPSREDIACRCGCGFAAFDWELKFILEHVAHQFGTSATVTSGCRCRARNEREKGSKNSYHLRGMAVDFFVPGISVEDVYAFLCFSFPEKYEIIIYDTIVHVAIQDSPERIDFRSKKVGV